MSFPNATETNSSVFFIVIFTETNSSFFFYYYLCVDNITLLLDPLPKRKRNGILIIKIIVL